MRLGLCDTAVPELSSSGSGVDRCHLSGAPEAIQAWG
jgi:hypothetical protein